MHFIRPISTAKTFVAVAIQYYCSQVVPRLRVDIRVVICFSCGSFLGFAFTFFFLRKVQPIALSSCGSSASDTFADKVPHVQKNRGKFTVFQSIQQYGKHCIKLIATHHRPTHNSRTFLTSVQIRLTAPVPALRGNTGDFLTSRRVTDDTHYGNLIGVIRSNSSRLDAIQQAGPGKVPACVDTKYLSIVSPFPALVADRDTTSDSARTIK